MREKLFGIIPDLLVVYVLSYVLNKILNKIIWIKNMHNTKLIIATKVQRFKEKELKRKIIR